MVTLTVLSALSTMFIREKEVNAVTGWCKHLLKHSGRKRYNFFLSEYDLLFWNYLFLINSDLLYSETGLFDPLTLLLNSSHWPRNTLKRHFLNSHMDTMSFIGQHADTLPADACCCNACRDNSFFFFKKNTHKRHKNRQTRSYMHAHNLDVHSPVSTDRQTQQFFCQARDTIKQGDVAQSQT